MNKLKSRKFWAWLVWTLIVIIGVILTKTVSNEILSWYGPVTIVWIGGETVIDAVTKLKGKGYEK